MQRHPTSIRIEPLTLNKLIQIVYDIEERQKALYVDNPGLAELTIFRSRNHLIHYILNQWVADYENKYGEVQIEKNKKK